jgi:hypothetical protein
MFQPPADDAPADEKHVSLLGPISLQAYKMGKQALAAVSAAHLANQQGEGAIGTNLAMYEKMPMVGDLVQLAEQGKITPMIAKGLTRAALLHSVGKATDLSATALAEPSAEVSAITGDIARPSPAGNISDARMAARKQFAQTPSGLKPTASPTESAVTSSTTASTSSTAPKAFTAPTSAATEVPANATPLSIEQRLASSFMRKQRLEPQGTVESNEPVTHNKGTPADISSDDELRAFITKQFGKRAQSGVEQVSTPGEVGVHEINIGGKTLGTGTPAQTAAEAAKQDALIRGYISKLEANTTGSDIDQLAAIKKRLGISTKPISAEATATEGAQPTADDLANLKSKLSGKASSYPYSKTEGDLSIAHRVQALDANNNSLGYVSALEDTSEPHTWRIDQADMGANAGKGFGTKAYTRLASEAAKQGKSLKSGGVVSDSAAGVWDKLKAAGLNVIETKTKAGRTFEIPAPSAVEDVPKSASTGKSQSMTADPVSKAPAGRIQQALSSNDRAFARHLPETEDISGDWSKYVKGLANERQ